LVFPTLSTREAILTAGILSCPVFKKGAIRLSIIDKKNPLPKSRQGIFASTILNHTRLSIKTIQPSSITS
jgi:hypothetical protein